MRVLLIAAAAGVLLAAPAKAAGYDKDYCGGQTYVGNPGHKYPHLHCGKNFFTYSVGANRLNMVEGAVKCGTVGNVRFQVTNLDPKTVENKDAMVEAVTKFAADHNCQ